MHAVRGHRARCQAEGLAVEGGGEGKGAWWDEEVDVRYAGDHGWGRGMLCLFLKKSSWTQRSNDEYIKALLEYVDNVLYARCKIGSAIVSKRRCRQGCPTCRLGTIIRHVNTVVLPIHKSHSCGKIVGTWRTGLDYHDTRHDLNSCAWPHIHERTQSVKASKQNLTQDHQARHIHLNHNAFKSRDQEMQSQLAHDW